GPLGGDGPDIQTLMGAGFFVTPDFGGQVVDPTVDAVELLRLLGGQLARFSLCFVEDSALLGDEFCALLDQIANGRHGNSFRIRFVVRIREGATTSYGMKPSKSSSPRRAADIRPHRAWATISRRLAGYSRQRFSRPSVATSLRGGAVHVGCERR